MSSSHPLRDVLGELQSEHGFARFGARAPSQTIGETQELQRVRDMPRRVWQDDPRLPNLVRLLTKKLRHTPEPCAVPCAGCKAQALRPAQAQALREAYSTGLVGALRPGAGKRMLSFLLPTILKAKKPLLIVPGADKKIAPRLHREYARHWRVMPMTIVTYEFLANPKHEGYLDQLCPDLIVADEAHKLSAGSIVTKRVGRYLRKSGARLCPLTGSLSGRSIMTYWHYAHWALPGRAPMPRRLEEAQAWGLALDEKVLEEARLKPGALLQLGQHPTEADELTKARRAYQDRFTSTPGVVSTLEDIPAVGLSITARVIDLPPDLCAAIGRMRNTYVTPGGESFSEPLELYRHSVSLGAGLYMRPNPPPPAEWLARRKAWHAFARQALEANRRWDSAVFVANAIDRGELDDGGLLAAWREIEPTFTWKSEPVWCDDTTIRYAAEWLKQEQGIVWVAQREAGVKLSALTGVPFFSTGARNQQGVSAQDWTRSMICSMHSCRERLDLQEHNWRNLLLTVPPKNTWMSQLIARTHRDGQPKDEVTVEILLTTRESFANLKQCVLDAQMDYTTHGPSHPLCYAQRDLGPVEGMLAGEEDIPGP